MLCPSALQIEAKFAHRQPAAWGERIAGVVSDVPVRRQKGVFLTFDACGSPYGSGYDAQLIAYLRREKIPATLFLNSRWIDATPRLFAQLARDPLFSVQNHGTAHRPLSVTGRAAWKIAGTASPRQVYDEIMTCHAKIATRLGYKIAGFDVLGNSEARLTGAQLVAAARRIRRGSIIIYHKNQHMNQPRKGTCDGIMRVVPKMKAAGCSLRVWRSIYKKDLCAVIVTNRVQLNAKTTEPGSIATDY